MRHNLRIQIASWLASSLAPEFVHYSESTPPLSFWKEVCRQYQCKWRASNVIVDLGAGYVNLRNHKSPNAIRCRIANFCMA
jgi:hypothetical protein